MRKAVRRPRLRLEQRSLDEAPLWKLAHLSLPPLRVHLRTELTGVTVPGITVAVMKNLPRQTLLPGVEVRKLLPKMSNLRRIVEDDVGIVRMASGIVLVVRLSGIEGFQWDHLGHDRTREDFCLIQLGDIRFGDSLLLIAAIEN